MADIKTRDMVKGTIKTIDKTAVAGQRLKQAYVATKEKAERSVNANQDSAEEYASEKLENGIDEAVHDGVNAFDKVGQWGVRTTKENIDSAKGEIQKFKAKRAEQGLRKQTGQATSQKAVQNTAQSTNSAIKTLEKPEKTIRQTASSAEKKRLRHWRQAERRQLKQYKSQ